VSVTVIVGGVTQAATPALTPITNRAMAVYPWQNKIYTTWSNWVTVVVQQVAGLVIYPCSVGTPASDEFVPACAQCVAPGQQVIIPYCLINTGNGVDTFRLTVKSWPKDAVQGAVIYHDCDGDAFADPSDPMVDCITLPSHKSAIVLVSFRTPDHSLDGDLYHTALRVESSVDPSVVVEETWNTVTVHAEKPNLFVRRSYNVDLPPPQGCLANMRVFRTLSATTTNADPLRSVVTHTILIENTGCSHTGCVRVLEPINHNETLLTDTYGPGLPLLINGRPVSLKSPTARLITDSDGNRFLEICMTSIEPRSQEPVVIEYKASINWQPGEQAMLKATEVIYERRPGELTRSVSNQVVVDRDLTYGAELVPKDSPIRNAVYTGERVHFGLSVANVGEIPCVPEVILSEPVPEGWQVSLCERDGVTPLYDNNNNGWVDLGILPPGAQRDVVLSILVPEDKNLAADAPFLFPITFFHADPPDCSATITFRIERVEGLDRLWDPLQMEVDAGEVVIPGSLLTYDLCFANASDREIRDVVVTTRLSPYLTPPIALDGRLGLRAGQSSAFMRSQEGTPIVYYPDRHAIVWTIASVPKGARGDLTFSTQVVESVPQGTVIDVQAELVCALTELAAVSNSVTTAVLTNELAVSLSATNTLVTMGDENTYYIDVTNVSDSIDLHDVRVRVYLPPGITYCPATSHQDGKPMADPPQSRGALVYDVGQVPKCGAVRLSFRGIVNAAADDKVTVRAVAAFRTRTDEWLESAVATLTTYVLHGVLSDDGVIVGRIRTGKGTALARVRVVLDNGRYAVSDQNGWFSFAGVRPGPRLLRLDPASLCGVADMERVAKVRVVVPTAGIAMVDLSLTPPTINAVTQSIVLEEGSI